jgi:hypothetical protein
MKRRGYEELEFCNACLSRGVFWFVSLTWSEPIKPVIFYSKTERGVGSKSYPLRFSLWDAETGGNRVWEEEKTLTTKSPVINTYLGEANSLSYTRFVSSKVHRQEKI